MVFLPGHEAMCKWHSKNVDKHHGQNWGESAWIGIGTFINKSRGNRREKDKCECKLSGLILAIVVGENQGDGFLSWTRLASLWFDADVPNEQQRLHMISLVLRSNDLRGITKNQKTFYDTWFTITKEGIRHEADEEGVMPYVRAMEAGHGNRALSSCVIMRHRRQNLDPKTKMPTARYLARYQFFEDVRARFTLHQGWDPCDVCTPPCGKTKEKCMAYQASVAKYCPACVKAGVEERFMTKLCPQSMRQHISMMHTDAEGKYFEEPMICHGGCKRPISHRVSASDFPFCAGCKGHNCFMKGGLSSTIYCEALPEQSLGDAPGVIPDRNMAAVCKNKDGTDFKLPSPLSFSARQWERINQITPRLILQHHFKPKTKTGFEENITHIYSVTDVRDKQTSLGFCRPSVELDQALDDLEQFILSKPCGMSVMWLYERYGVAQFRRLVQAMMEGKTKVEEFLLLCDVEENLGVELGSQARFVCEYMKRSGGELPKFLSFEYNVTRRIPDFDGNLVIRTYLEELNTMIATRDPLTPPLVYFPGTAFRGAIEASVKDGSWGTGCEAAWIIDTRDEKEALERFVLDGPPLERLKVKSDRNAIKESRAEAAGDGGGAKSQGKGKAKAKRKAKVGNNGDDKENVVASEAALYARVIGASGPEEEVDQSGAMPSDVPPREAKRLRREEQSNGQRLNAECENAAIANHGLTPFDEVPLASQGATGVDMIPNECLSIEKPCNLASPEKAVTKAVVPNQKGLVIASKKSWRSKSSGKLSLKKKKKSAATEETSSGVHVRSPSSGLLTAPVTPGTHVRVDAIGGPVPLSPVSCLENRDKDADAVALTLKSDMRDVKVASPLARMNPQPDPVKTRVSRGIITAYFPVKKQ